MPRFWQIVVPEPEATGQALFDTVTELLNDYDRRKKMSAELRNMVVTDSAQRIRDMIEELSAKGGK